MEPILSSQSILPFIILAGLVLACAAGVILLIIRRRKGSIAQTGLARQNKLAYQPAARPVLILPKVKRTGLPRETVPDVPPKEIEILKGRSSLRECLDAVVEKYTLESFTLATSDGLVIASTDGDSAQEDAARYADLFVNSPLCETPGAVLFGISYKGSDLVGIIRSNRDLSDKICENIGDDTKDILNIWI